MYVEVAVVEDVVLAVGVGDELGLVKVLYNPRISVADSVRL